MLKAGRWDLGALGFMVVENHTLPNGTYTITLLDGTVTEYVSIGDKNGLRLDPYHRLDLSANYNLNIGNVKSDIGVSILIFTTKQIPGTSFRF